MLTSEHKQNRVLAARDFSSPLGGILSPISPYSPDLAASDYHFFTKLNEYIEKQLIYTYCTISVHFMKIYALFDFF